MTQKQEIIMSIRVNIAARSSATYALGITKNYDRRSVGELIELREAEFAANPIPDSTRARGLVARLGSEMYYSFNLALVLSTAPTCFLDALSAVLDTAKANRTEPSTERNPQA